MAIKELLGHRTLAMTERYCHLIPDTKKQAVLALEASFNESRNGEKLIALEKEREITPVEGDNDLTPSPDGEQGGNLHRLGGQLTLEPEGETEW